MASSTSFLAGPWRAREREKARNIGLIVDQLIWYVAVVDDAPRHFSLRLQATGYIAYSTGSLPVG
jgi:hypothetical protein